LKNRAQVHFHAGSFECMAEVALIKNALIENVELSPGDESFAQLRLKQSVLVLPGDRFIIRQSSPLVTIAAVWCSILPRRLRTREASRREFHQAPNAATSRRFFLNSSPFSLWTLLVRNSCPHWLDRR